MLDVCRLRKGDRLAAAGRVVLLPGGVCIVTIGNGNARLNVLVSFSVVPLLPRRTNTASTRQAATSRKIRNMNKCRTEEHNDFGKAVPMLSGAHRHDEHHLLLMCSCQRGSERTGLQDLASVGRAICRGLCTSVRKTPELENFEPKR